MRGTRRDFVAKGAKRCSIWHAAARPRKALVNSRTVEHAEDVRRHKARRLPPRGERVDLWPPHIFPVLSRRKKRCARFVHLPHGRWTHSFNYQLIRNS